MRVGGWGGRLFIRVDMSRKLEMAFGGWEGDGEAIVVVVVVVFLEERWWLVVVFSRNNDCVCVVRMLTGILDAHMAQKRWFLPLQAYIRYLAWISLRLGYVRANKETCRDCANLVVDLDWTL